MITDSDGTKHRAADFFGRALDWWTSFIYGHELDEPQ